MDSNMAKCACQKVVYLPKEVKPNLMLELWACDQCGREFVPASRLSTLPEDAEKVLLSARAAAEHLTSGIQLGNKRTALNRALSLLSPALARVKELEAYADHKWDCEIKTQEGVDEAKAKCTCGYSALKRQGGVG